jgi:hypothetical protein
MEKIRAIVYGVGAMGKMMTKLMVEKGINIVGAIDLDPEVVDRDLGDVAGLGYPLNVTISNNADTVLSEQKADIAVMAVFTEMERMYPHLKKCAENGLNVITTSEEASYPWSTSPELAAKLDRLAKKHGVTITGSGFQDGFWINMISVLTGASHTIESITARATYNLDDYGAAVAEYSHVGQTKEDFDRWLKEEGAEPSIFRMHLEALIADLGLTVKGIQESTEPTIDDIDLQCKSLGKTVKKGKVTGMSQIVEIETGQGINFRGELIGKVYRPDEEDINEWHIKGVPELYLKNDKVPTRTASGTQIVNRIPDIINAEPGYITLEKLPKLKYRAYPLHFYLHRQ